jgi:AAA domain
MSPDVIHEHNMPGMNSNEKRYIRDLMSRMASMDETQASFKLLLYGDSGVGKTVEAMHIAQALTPADKIILYIDSAEGWVSLNNFPVLKRRTQRMTITRSSMMEDIANAIREGANIFGQVGCVVIDEHSSIADYDLLAVAKSRADSGNSGDKDPDQPTQPDMGVTTNRIFKFTSGLIAIPNVHVILVTHSRIDKDNIGKTRTAPAYMPVLSKRMRELVHVVGNMTADIIVDREGKQTYNRRIQVQPTLKIVAKTRIGGLPVQVTPNELIAAAKEWLGGSRPTQEAQVLAKDEGVEVKREIIADEVTDVVVAEDLTVETI